MTNPMTAPAKPAKGPVVRAFCNRGTVRPFQGEVEIDGVVIARSGWCASESAAKRNAQEEYARLTDDEIAAKVARVKAYYSARAAEAEARAALAQAVPTAEGGAK